MIRLTSSSVMVNGYADTAFAGAIVTGLTLTSDIAIKFTGEATTTNDVIQKFLMGTYLPAN